MLVNVKFYYRIQRFWYAGSVTKQKVMIMPMKFVTLMSIYLV